MIPKALDRLFDARLLPLIGPLLLFGVWQLVIAAQWVKPVLLPPPGETLAHLWEVVASGAIREDFVSTLVRTLSAFGIAVLIGVPLGVMLGSSVNAYRSVEFLIDFFRSTPSSALIPLFLLIFGITDANKIAIAAFAAVPLGVMLGSSVNAYRSVEFLIDFFRSTPSSALIPLFLLIFGITDANKIAIAAFAAVLLVLFNSAYGVMNAKKTRVMAAQIMGVSRWHVFKDVMLMESLAQTFVGLRTGVSMSLVIVIVAEMFIGSETGLGHRIIDAQQVFNVKDMYTSILITGALGYALNLVFLLIEKRLVHWSGKA